MLACPFQKCLRYALCTRDLACWRDRLCVRAQEDIGVGGVLSLLWFRKRLPAYATKFIEMVLMVTADHGPAVSGAHNTIVTARAGKDLVSSLVSGLLTVGPRFGGALDGMPWRVLKNIFCLFLIESLCLQRLLSCFQRRTTLARTPMTS